MKGPVLAKSDQAQTRPRPGFGSAAQQLADVVTPIFGTLPVRLRAWDGSESGPQNAPVITLRSPDALRRLVYHPGELGLAQAYVTGDLDVEGDLLDGFRRVWQTIRERGITGRPSLGVLAAGGKAAVRLGVVGMPPAPPDSQARLRGRLHTALRDRAAISHHYDLSNDFYQLILDPHMAYSCGYWTSDDPSYTGADAQRDKLALVCAKLGLQPGMRMLDVGCGWGSLSLYAAENFDVDVTSVTLAKEQCAFVQARIGERGLHNMEVRHQDYRDVADGPFDAISSIEMGEHVGRANYPAFAAQLRSLLKPRGRLLIQQMSRRTQRGGGPFIDAFIAPDMDMRPVGETVEMLEAAGLEVRDVHVMREHYVRTIHEWYHTFESHWADAVALVGEEVARVWRLYMVGAALSFEEGRMGVDQVLAVKSTGGRSGMPAVRTV
ncbi:MAG: class I SAM-dependent methyltransferase [Nocardioidaceae bacterium]|nr:class I SAM-dependent methyltransferase [Nocardioidaceae bacterium]